MKNTMAASRVGLDVTRHPRNCYKPSGSLLDIGLMRDATSATGIAIAISVSDQQRLKRRSGLELIRRHSVKARPGRRRRDERAKGVGDGALEY